jgi:hypothetical protein
MQVKSVHEKRVALTRAAMLIKTASRCDAQGMKAFSLRLQEKARDVLFSVANNSISETYNFINFLFHNKNNFVRDILNSGATDIFEFQRYVRREGLYVD